MAFEPDTIKAERFVLKGPGGTKDFIGTTKVLAAGIVGTKLVLIQQGANTAEANVFDLKRISGDGPNEPAITPDEFLALKEEVREIRKAQAREALGTDVEVRRGPGRPPKVAF